MKKIFTLLLTMLFGVIVEAMATDKQTTVYKGEFASGEWAQNITLDKDVFANAKNGDILYVKWKLDTESAIAKDGTADAAYYQFNITFPYSDWTDKLVASIDVKNTASHYAHTLSAEELTKLQTYGIAIGARFLKITDVVIGNPFSATNITYWDTDAWKYATEKNITFPNNEWTSCTLNGDIVATANIGDRLTVTFNPGSSELWNSQLQVIDASNSGWAAIMGIPVGGLTTMSLLVDEDILEAFQHKDIRLNGTNLTITNIQLEQTNLYYLLSAKNTNVDISKLPTETSINVDLYRKLDWNTTICVPFEITDIETKFGNSAKAYELNNKSGDKLVFTGVSTIEAGKPYLMTFDMTGIDESNKTMTKSFENVTINTTLTDNTEVSGFTFKGNYSPSMSMNGLYGVACKQHDENWDWGFYQGSSTSTLPAFSAYIQTGVSPSRGFSISTGDGTTNIDAFEAVEEVTDGPIYNLMGIQTNAPQKGIYIKNGKKYIAK